jgi:hypothetical protein
MQIPQIEGSSSGPKLGLEATLCATANNLRNNMDEADYTGNMLPKSDRASLPERRAFLIGATAVVVTNMKAVATGQLLRGGRSLVGKVGVTTGSFVRHLTKEVQPGNLRLLDLPKVLRRELDMEIIDLMTATLSSSELDYLKQLRDAAEEQGCILTNLKMNQPGLNLGSDDPEERSRAIDEYQRTIDAAAILGVWWVRPLPGPRRPELDVLAASYRKLIDYAAPKGISLLIENFGWLASDPTAIPTLLEKVGSGLAAQPDTGNWSDNEVRYAGLAKAFPHAVSCDFKARNLGPGGAHEAYDLKRCFDIGWDAGFRGPWCFEYTHTDLAGLYRDLGTLRNLIRSWIAARR